MTAPDRELLELAAKAAGLQVSDWMPGSLGFWCAGKRWNPLADDGDALRLAVKLDIIYGRYSNTYWARRDCDDKTFRENGERNGVQDPYAATRRAIVRAAAVIGRAMP